MNKIQIFVLVIFLILFYIILDTTQMVYLILLFKLTFNQFLI